MDTPLTDHLTPQDYAHVYEPAEDSFLLLDALEADLPFLEHLAPSVCLEIGSGSGIIITALAKRFKHSLCLASDINLEACKATQRTAKRNGTSVGAMRCNLLDAVRPNCIDVLLFNPPYVVTPDEELRTQKFVDAATAQTAGNLVYSWAGGAFGRRVIDELLPCLDKALSPCGVFYLLLLRENKPDEIIEQLGTLRFKAIKFMERRIPGEYLYILKVTRL